MALKVCSRKKCFEQCMLRWGEEYGELALNQIVVGSPWFDTSLLSQASSTCKSHACF